tara:strand:- start:282 stop:587 length:306 start_codon:yes stop_codon:yes gene_type:complete
MTIKGFSKHTFSSDLTNPDSKYKNKSVHKERIIMEELNNDGTYQALVKDFDNNMKEPLEYYVKKRGSMNDLLVDNKINQMFLGGVTVIGLFVLYRLLQKSK